MSNFDSTLKLPLTGPLVEPDAIPKLDKPLKADETPPPPAPPGDGTDGIAGDFLPKLDRPRSGGLSLESLLSSISYESRRQACQQGIERLEAKAKDQKIVGESQLEKITERVEEFQKQKKLAPIMKALSICGVIVGAIVGVAGLFTGGAGFALAGAIISLAMTANSIVSLATDGEYSIARGVTELTMLAGGSEETGQYIGIAVELFISILAAAFSLGGSAASSASKFAEVLPKLNNAVKVGQIVGGGVTVATGGIGIETSLIAEDAAKAEAGAKLLDAILENINLAKETEESLLQVVVQKSSKLLEDVSDIVDECNDTLMVVQGASGARA